MRSTMIVLAATATFGLAVPHPAPAQGPPEHAQAGKKDGSPGQAARAQGQGQGQGQGQAKKQGQAKGQGQVKAQGQGKGQGQARAGERGGPPAHAATRRGWTAPDPAEFNRNLVEKAVRARGRRAAGAGAVTVRRESGRVRVVRDGGGVLFELSEPTVERLGYWSAAVLPTVDRRDGPDLGDIFGRRDGGDRYPVDRDRGEGPPAFCRSGAGHPVWGRDWCLDKGFGLGDRDRRWGATTDIGDIILRRPDPERRVLDRGGLIDVLGDIVFGRLAMQSLVLGAEQPLEGRWIGERDGPRVLRVQAGDLPVAELVDYGSDGRVDRIIFNLGG